jgi:hypothetical protein
MFPHRERPQRDHVRGEGSEERGGRPRSRAEGRYGAFVAVLECKKEDVELSESGTDSYT